MLFALVNATVIIMKLCNNIYLIYNYIFMCTYVCMRSFMGSCIRTCL